MCFSATHFDTCTLHVTHNGVQAALVTKAAAAADAAGLALRCCVSGERNTGDKWAPLAPHD